MVSRGPSVRRTAKSPRTVAKASPIPLARAMLWSNRETLRFTTADW